MMIALTLYHSRPSKTPTRSCFFAIGVEVDFHFVRFGCYDRRLEVKGMRWSEERRVAAAVVHQGRPIPIGDSDKVFSARSVGRCMETNIDGKGGEFKSQYLSGFQCNAFPLVNVMGIVARMVWGGDHTWGNSHSILSKQLHHRKNLLNYLLSHNPHSRAK